jgi:pyruvate formate lyase activating enzyme
MLPPIKGFINQTLIDWEGKIASEIFLPGCNFRCPMCHSAHLVVSPNTLESIPFYAIRDYIREQKDWIDGIVISGGEALMQREIESLCSEFKQLELPVKIDTNGSFPEVLESLVDKRLVDYVAMDLKATLDDSYRAVAGVDVDLAAIGKSIALLQKGEVDHEFRTTVCSFFLDKSDILNIARMIDGARRYVLQEFKPGSCLDPTLNEYQSFTREELREMAEEASEYVQACYVRGEDIDISTQPDTGATNEHNAAQGPPSTRQ